MEPEKKVQPQIKSRLHKRNKHRERYDFEALIASCPELAEHVLKNKYGDDSINFSYHPAVKMLNTALLKHYYDITYWDVPADYLCPPIPGRADYIHNAADLIGGKNYGKIPRGKNIKCLDIGVGANCIYPIIGHKEYGWSFVGSDIDPIAIESAKTIIDKNKNLSEDLEIRLQENSKNILKGIIQYDEKFDLTICNPPFHASMEAAKEGTLRKLSNLTKKKVSKPVLNFGGQKTELWTEGGERQFVRTLIRQSKRYGQSCFWYSTLISKESNLKSVYESLRISKAEKVITTPMGQGNKSSRIVAWTFLDSAQQKQWSEERWQEKTESK